MEAKQPRRRSRESAARKPPPTRDRLFELSFYVGALALIVLMEWYTQQSGKPRMLWAYFALMLIAAACAAARVRPLRLWLRRLRKHRSSRPH